VRVQPFAGVMRLKLERLEALERTRLQKLAEAELARAEVERLQEDAKRLQAEEAAKRQLARCATHRQTSLKLSRLRDTPTDF